MSYINIHQVDQSAVEGVIDKEPTSSLTDGEEIAACAKLLKLLDDLTEGQALVIWKDIF